MRPVAADHMERSTDRSHARGTGNAYQRVVEIDRCQAGGRSKLCAQVFSNICLPCNGICLPRHWSRRGDSLWCRVRRSGDQGIHSRDRGKLVFLACMDQMHRERGSTPDVGHDRMADSMEALPAHRCICKRARR